MKPMTRSTILVICGFLLFSMALTALSTMSIAYGQSATPTAIPLPHWTYEGAEGPDKWGKLDDRFAVCATGHAQSPIDLTKAQKLDLVDIKFNYKPNLWAVKINNEALKGMLAPEFDSSPPPFAKKLPKVILGRSRVVAQLLNKGL